MMTEVKIDTEPVDDIPLILQQLEKMGIREVLDNVISPHGHRRGLSVGCLTQVWLSYILSESDHRMSEVEPWVEERLETLSHLVPQSLQVKDFTDDRLADILRMLSQDQNWEAIEIQLGQHLIDVYTLPVETLRLDSTSVSVYHDKEGQSLFRPGHSKDHRPDLAQFKVMLGTLDPLGLPIASLVVAGNCADDPLYVPTILQSQKVIGTGGHLYVGDSKMSALHTRGVLQASDDFYLCPLAQVGQTPEFLRQILAPVLSGEQALQKVESEYDNDNDFVEDIPLALGFETVRCQEALVEARQITWDERVLAIYSPELAQASARGLDIRLGQAEKSLQALTPSAGRGKKRWDNLEALQKAAEAILAKHRVKDLLEIGYIKAVEQRHIRKYKDRPARIEENIRYIIKVKYSAQAIEKARQIQGWRLYVTNAPIQRLSLTQAFFSYRHSSRIEHNFSRLKGRPLGLKPLYIQRDDHAKGMARLLCLAVRALTLIEYVVRENLMTAGEKLAGLYSGNPKRQTARPTTERLLKAFKGIVLTRVCLPNKTIRHITPLTLLQSLILNLLGEKDNPYQQLLWLQKPIPL